MAASATIAAPPPQPVALQLREVPTARTMVRASTISTVAARKAAENSSTSCIAPHRSERGSWLSRSIHNEVSNSLSYSQQMGFRERAFEVGPTLSPVLQRVVDHLLGAGPEVVLL